MENILNLRYDTNFSKICFNINRVYANMLLQNTCYYYLKTENFNISNGGIHLQPAEGSHGLFTTNITK